MSAAKFKHFVMWTYDTLRSYCDVLMLVNVNVSVNSILFIFITVDDDARLHINKYYIQ